MKTPMRGSPEVHVALHGQRQNVWQASPWTAATDEHSHSLDGTHLEDFGHTESSQGHDAELGQQCNGHSFWLEEMGLDFGNLHCTANGYHTDEEVDHAEDIDGFVYGVGGVQECHTSIVRDFPLIVDASYSYVDFCRIDCGAHLSSCCVSCSASFTCHTKKMWIFNSKGITVWDCLISSPLVRVFFILLCVLECFFFFNGKLLITSL